MMAECQVGGGDGLIKLFGKTIPVPEAKGLHHSGGGGGGSSSSSTESDAAPETAQQDASDQSPQPEPEVVDAEDPNKSSPDTPRPGAGDDAASLREKLKKPDKVLPCPRCSSMDTKFCYFNNYNVNQPRHFCKNCQRYWTAGGAMRNVPVGAGRRKNKHAVAASHFFHRVRAVLPDAAGGVPLKTTGGTVLSFAPHGHHLAEQQVNIHHLKEKLLVPAARTTNAGNPALSGPCSEAEGSSNSRDHQDTTTSPHGGIKEKSTVENEKPENGSGVHLPAPSASMNNGATTVWPPPAATYFSSGIAIPIYPAAPGYWGCCMVPGPWSLPWPVQAPPQAQGLVSPTTAPPSVSSSGPVGPGSLTLGKHPRDREGDEAKVWAPKTIRIDDADEVARSSIWSLIRIKGDKTQDEADHAGVGHRLGTVFESKLEAKKMAKQEMAATGSPPPLPGHANPVALTRSVTFQEGS
ncbi:hypothetical protein BS78_01G249100 [Paspalum vaginatum]|nr:hypothetical protein BS78_01G249100 [Paspalum vaginatum]